MSAWRRAEDSAHLRALFLVGVVALAAALTWRIGVAAFDPALHPFWVLGGYAVTAKVAGDAVATRLREGSGLRLPGVDDALVWIFPLVVCQRLVASSTLLGPLTPLATGPLPAVIIYLIDLHPRLRVGVERGALSDRLVRWP